MARYYDDDDEDHIDMRPLLRLGAWGACTAIALGVAVIATRGDTSTERMSVALETLRQAPDFLTHPMRVLAAVRPGGASDEETRHLEATVRSLTTDRDALAARVAALEHDLNDLTGSVGHDQTPAQPNPVVAATAPASAPPNTPTTVRLDDRAPPAVTFPPPAGLDIASTTTTTATDDTRSLAPAPAASQPPATQPAQSGIGQPANVPLPRPGPLATIQSYVSSTLPPATGPRVAEAAPGADATATTETATSDTAPKEMAIELAIATNVNALRVRWGTIRTGHAGLVEGLRPLVAVRPSSRPGFTEFHLVAGPVADADAAARLCSTLATAKIPCRPAPYDGQSLDLR